MNPVRSQRACFKENYTFPAVNLKITFEKDAVLLIDNTNSIINKFRLHFELDRISRLQLWGSIKGLRSIALKYNQKQARRSPRKT